MADLLIDFKGNGIIKLYSRKFSFDCYIIPKESISSNIEELETINGVYFLINDNESKAIKRHIYIGKTTQGRLQRFADHKKEKDFWNKLVLFNASSKYFDETIVYGLERIFIKKYKESNLYEMQQKDSKREIDDDCYIFVEDISNMMEFLQYPSEKEIPQDSEDINPETNKLFDLFDEKIKKISNDIQQKAWKLYFGYSTSKKNLCAVWVRNYGLEIELYASKKDFKSYDFVYDTASRGRGGKKCALKVTTKVDVDTAIEIVSKIIKE